MRLWHSPCELCSSLNVVALSAFKVVPPSLLVFSKQWWHQATPKAHPPEYFLSTLQKTTNKNATLRCVFFIWTWTPQKRGWCFMYAWLRLLYCKFSKILMIGSWKGWENEIPNTVLLHTLTQVKLGNIGSFSQLFWILHSNKNERGEKQVGMSAVWRKVTQNLFEM